MASNQTKRAPTLSLREEQKRLTRQRLREAARDAFHEKGYSNATIDDIVERSGASRGTYYLYYHNKTEILEELLEEYNEAARELARHLAELETDSEGHIRIDALEKWIAAFVDLYQANRLSIRAWLQAESSEPSLHATTDRNLNAFADVLADWISAARRGPRRKQAVTESRVRGLLMLLQLERFCYFAVIRNWKIDRKVAISTIARLWHDGIYDQG